MRGPRRPDRTHRAHPDGLNNDRALMGTGAYSTGHESPLNGAREPTQRGTRAHSTGHESPLNGARAPTQRAGWFRGWDSAGSRSA
jgi:hypothetical protein